MPSESYANSAGPAFFSHGTPNALLLDSPVEFALVGIHNGRIRIIAQSTGAKIDILEGAISADIKEPNELPHKDRTMYEIMSFFLSTLLNEAPPKNAVKTRAVAHTIDEDDERYASFTLFWRGHRTKFALDGIEQEFSRLGADIYISSHNGTSSDFSLILASTIAKCARAHARGTALRKLSRFTFLVYVAMTFLIAATAMFADRIHLP